MTEQVNGLPEVEGLADFVKADTDLTQDKAQDNTEVQEKDSQVDDAAAPATDNADDIDWGNFKNPKDLLKSYKEIQGFTTRVSQENKQLKEEMQRIREERELANIASKAPAPQMDSKSFEELFLENPEQAIAVKAAQMANTQRIAEILEDEETAKPEEFNERLAYVKMLANQQQYAPLSNSPKGVKKLFQLADTYRKNMTEKKAYESLKVLFGEDVDIGKLKGLIKKDGASTIQTQNNAQANTNAYMPDVTGSTKTGAEADQKRNQLKTFKDEAFKRGDAEAVAGAILREALLR